MWFSIRVAKQRTNLVARIWLTNLSDKLFVSYLHSDKVSDIEKTPVVVKMPNSINEAWGLESLLCDANR
jgi:hypothetical protein